MSTQNSTKFMRTVLKCCWRKISKRLVNSNIVKPVYVIPKFKFELFKWFKGHLVHKFNFKTLIRCFCHGVIIGTSLSAKGALHDRIINLLTAYKTELLSYRMYAQRFLPNKSFFPFVDFKVNLKECETLEAIIIEANGI